MDVQARVRKRKLKFLDAITIPYSSNFGTLTA